MTPLGWVGILRLGVVQAALGGIVVLVTSTLNRVMVVELALPAVVPGALIALHYAVQLLRPRWGHGSDGSGRRVPWILGGMALLAGGAVGAAASIAVIPDHPVLGLVAAAVAYAAVGLGVGAAGTATLVLAATRVAAERRAVAAPVLWIMMIAGFAVTAGVAGAWLEPFSILRLCRVTGIVGVLAVLVTAAATWRLEGAAPESPAQRFTPAPPVPFGQALAQIWSEPEVRRFALFVFLSMLAYSAQDLVLEPFAGLVLHVPPGGTTQLSGLQHGGALLGMLAVGVLAGVAGRHRPHLMGSVAISGCVLSGLTLSGLAGVALTGTFAWSLRPAVAMLGFGNGVFAVAAVGAMMTLSAQSSGQQGLRMGLWGAAQAAAFGLGSLAGPALVDVARLVLRTPGPSYGLVFLAEAALFAAAATLARRNVASVPAALAAPPSLATEWA